MSKGGNGGDPQPPISSLVANELFETLMNCVPPQALKPTHSSMLGSGFGSTSGAALDHRTAIFNLGSSLRPSDSDF